MTITASLAAAMSYIILLTDDILVGQLINEQAVGGVNLVMPFKTFMIFLSILISCGATSCMVIEIARFDKRRTDCYFYSGIYLSVAAGILLCAAALGLGDVYFGYLDADSVSYFYAKEYFKYFALFVLFYPLFSFLQLSVYTDGDEALYILSAAAQIVGNIVFSLILCKYMGIGGISLGTALGVVLGMLVLLQHFRQRKNSLHLSRGTSLSMLKAIAENGITAASPLLFVSIFTQLFNHFFTIRFGEDMLPVLAVAANAQEITTLFEGFGLALAPFATMYAGEYNTKQLRKILSRSLGSSLSFCAAVGVLVIILARPFVRQFGVIGGIHFEKAVLAVRLIPIGFLASAYLQLLFSYHTSAGSLKYGMYISALKGLAAPGILVFPLAAFGSSDAVWYGMAFAPLLACLLTVLPVKVILGPLASPFLLKWDHVPYVYFYELDKLDEAGILRLRDEVDRVLERHSVCSTARYHSTLLIEEIFMLVLEKNEGKELSAEFTLKLDGDVFLVFKDSGKLFDVTDTDMTVSSFRAFALSRLMEYHDSRINMTTLCCNRNAFCLPLQQKGN